MAANRKQAGRTRATPRKPPPGPRSLVGVTVEEVRELSLGLPHTTERPCYGTAGFRVRDKLFARVLPDGEAIIVKVDFEARDALVASAPEVFSVTPHYQGHPWVIVSLRTVPLELLRELLTEAWRSTASPRLIEAFDAARRR